MPSSCKDKHELVGQLVCESTPCISVNLESPIGEERIADGTRPLWGPDNRRRLIDISIRLDGIRQEDAVKLKELLTP